MHTYRQIWWFWGRRVVVLPVQLVDMSLPLEAATLLWLHGWLQLLHSWNIPLSLGAGPPPVIRIKFNWKIRLRFSVIHFILYLYYKHMKLNRTESGMLLSLNCNFNEMLFHQTIRPQGKYTRPYKLLGHLTDYKLTLLSGKWVIIVKHNSGACISTRNMESLLSYKVTIKPPVRFYVACNLIALHYLHTYKTLFVIGKVSHT